MTPTADALLAGLVIGGIVGAVISCCITMWMDEYRIPRDPESR